jgi:deazaflavin-dependent oxidoreductase (nitroreductase family)
MSTKSAVPFSDQLITERLAYPAQSPMKYVYKTPILLYRMGLGKLIGQLFMIMTTTGRKSGLPRRTAVEFHQHAGRKYVMVGWRQSDWYQNILTNPLLTIQTADGIEHVRARRLESDADYIETWNVAVKNTPIRVIMKLMGITMTRDKFVAQKNGFILLTFDHTDEATPPPMDADLTWVPLAILNIAGAFVVQAIIRRSVRARQKHRT